MGDLPDPTAHRLGCTCEDCWPSTPKVEPHKTGAPIAFEIAQLRQLYTILMTTSVPNRVGLAVGLLAPVIRNLERKFP